MTNRERDVGLSVCNTDRHDRASVDRPQVKTSHKTDHPTRYTANNMIDLAVQRQQSNPQSKQEPTLPIQEITEQRNNTQTVPMEGEAASDERRGWAERPLVVSEEQRQEEGQEQPEGQVHVAKACEETAALAASEEGQKQTFATEQELWAVEEQAREELEQVAKADATAVVDKKGMERVCVEGQAEACAACVVLVCVVLQLEKLEATQKLSLAVLVSVLSFVFVLLFVP